MGEQGDSPIVVRVRDEVTGSLAVVRVGEIGTVIDVWFPRLTPGGREVVWELKASLESQDWRRVDGAAQCLGLRIERLDHTGVVPSQRLASDDERASPSAPRP